MARSMADLQEQFGPIDIYLFDQLLRGRIGRGMRILDAGCGSGRNLVYFLREGYDVLRRRRGCAGGGEHSPPRGIPGARSAGRTTSAWKPSKRCRFPTAFADVVLSSAVLHFARGRRAVSGDAAQHVAGAETGRPPLLPPGIFHRHGRPDAAHRRHGGSCCPTVRSATWLTRSCWSSSPKSWADG